MLPSRIPPLLSSGPPSRAARSPFSKRAGARTDAVKAVLGTGVAGLGLGATVAAVAHLLNRERPAPRDATETEIHLPYPQLAPEQVKRGADMLNVPWALPGMAAAGTGGALLGSHLVKDHYRKKRKAQLEDELQKAQKEYESSMLGQYDQTKLHKIAALDRLCDAIEKKAAMFSSGAEQGGYLTLAALLAAGAGVGTKGYLDARSKEKLLKDALKHRALLRQQQNPPDVYVHPVPTRLQPPGTETTTEDPLSAETM